MNINETSKEGQNKTPECQDREILNYLNKNLDFRMSDIEKFGHSLTGKRDDLFEKETKEIARLVEIYGYDPYSKARLRHLQEWFRRREHYTTTFHHYRTLNLRCEGYEKMKAACREIFKIRTAMDPKIRKMNKDARKSNAEKPKAPRKYSGLCYRHEILFGRLVNTVKEALGITCIDLSICNDFRKWVSQAIAWKAILMTEQHAKNGMKILMGEEYVIPIAELRKKIKWCFQFEDNMVFKSDISTITAELEDPVLKKYAYIYQTFFLDELEQSCRKYAKLIFDCDFDLAANDREITMCSLRINFSNPLYIPTFCKYIYERGTEDEYRDYD